MLGRSETSPPHRAAGDRFDFACYIGDMDLDLDEDGNPQSAFIKACDGRRIDLAAKDNGPHLLQLTPAKWRELQATLEVFVDELETVETAIDPNGEALMKAFRQLTYDGTELFDCYANALPKWLAPRSKAEKAALKDYSKVASRLRDHCALICNQCKHTVAQLKFLWARSPTNGVTGSRFLVTKYGEGDALIRDDVVHKGKEAGIGMVRWAHQLAHNLLRIDRAAGALIGEFDDIDCEPTKTIPPSLPIGASLRKLAAIRATRHADEDRLHNGLEFCQDRVCLVRVAADDFGPSATITAALKIEPGTTRYSVA